jgi:hypothetical protein
LFDGLPRMSSRKIFEGKKIAAEKPFEKTNPISRNSLRLRAL